MKRFSALVCAAGAALSLAQAHANQLDAPLPAGGTMHIDTSDVTFEGSGRSAVTAHSVTDGIGLSFAGDTPGLGATVRDSLTTTPLPTRLSMPMQFSVPVSFDSSRASGFAVHIEGLTGAGATYRGEGLQNLYRAQYSYQLTLDALGGTDTGTLRLLDKSGAMPINSPSPATLMPASWDALVPAGFDLRGLTATLSIGLSYQMLGIGGDIWREIGPLKEGSALVSITSLSIQAIPEPGTWSLMVVGLLGLHAARRRQGQRQGQRQHHTH